MKPLGSVEDGGMQKRTGSTNNNNVHCQRKIKQKRVTLMSAGPQRMNLIRHKRHV